MPILQWLNRDKSINQASQVPYRLLNAQDQYSYGDQDTENMVIQGDNLDTLKALLPYYAGQVKCIYIDPPYNTGSAFEHYDDNLEHSTWLSMMYPRLEMLNQFLDKQGFICCHIDDSEGHYIKVILDEVFGRSNYLTTLYIQVRYASKTLKQDMDFHKQMEQVHIYRKGYGAKPILKLVEQSFDKFEYFIVELSSGKETVIGNKKVVIFDKNDYKIIKRKGSEDGLKEIWASGNILDGNSSGRFFRDFLTGRYNEDGYGVLYKVHGIGDDKYPYRYFTGPKKEGTTKGKYYQGVPMSQLENKRQSKTVPMENLYNLAGSFGNCRLEGGASFRSGKKPEVLLETILRHFSSPGDIVLDSFLGSGTTAAVAHKMGRRYIGIEMGEHAKTHCVERLKKVVDGEQGGISKSVEWKGGGGFRFYTLGGPIFDENGHIHSDISFDHLAAHIWFSETHRPYQQHTSNPLLGIYNGVAYYLLYNGILGDKRPHGGNVLTTKVFSSLPKHDGPKIIYGESSRLGPERLSKLNITFKQTPYDVKAR